MTLGQRIRQQRDKRGITRFALAITLSTTERTIARWERDEAEPTLATLARLAAALGVTLAWLVDPDQSEA